MEASIALPAQNITTSDQPPSNSVPLDSTRLLIAAESFRGHRTPMRFASPLDLTRKLERTGVGIAAWDAIDVAFRSGVPEVFLCRVLGPAAASASLNLAGGSGTSITITAAEPGEWANGAAGGVSVEVINGPAGVSERVIILRRESTPEKEIGRTTAETTRAALITAVERIGVSRGPDGSVVKMFTAVGGADVGLPNVVGQTNLAGGLSDAGSITNTHVRAALDALPREYGPMNVAIPGRSTDAANTMLLDYCDDTDRTALLEQASGLAVGTITASAAVLRALGTGAAGQSRLGGMWAQHATGPGIAPGTTRTVPWTIIVAGLIARLEAAEGHPNVAPFEDFGVPLWAEGLDREFTEAEAATLYEAGVNLAQRHPLLGLRNRTFRTLDDPTTSAWTDLAHTRLERYVRHLARDIGRNMGARVITRETISAFGGRLRGALGDLLIANALYSASGEPDDAYRVDVDSVNDAESIAAREVNADVGLCMGEHVEFVNINLAKIPIGQGA